MIDKKNEDEIDCPCGSGCSVKACCLSVISHQSSAEMPVQLMRSRYTAYVLGNVEYLLQSWHMSTRPQNIELDSRLIWTGLRLLSESRVVEEMGRKTAYVEFIAHFISAGIKGQMHERSRFLFEDGLWFYVDGEQIESAAHYVNKPPGRNAPCYCGSGKKFKKCCGV